LLAFQFDGPIIGDPVPRLSDNRARVAQLQGPMNQPNIAILSSALDPHSRAVAWGARESGASVTVLDTYRGIDPDGKAFAVRSGRARILGLEPFSVIWGRQPYRVQSPDAAVTEDAGFAERERNTFQSGLIECLETIEGVRWINRPSHQRLAENKLLQLTTALTVCLRTPETVITSDPGVVRTFLRGRSEIFVKPLQPDRRDYRDKKSRSAFAIVLGAEDISQLPDQDISARVAIYQERVRKHVDVRVVVLGERAFAFTVIQKNEPGIDSPFSLGELGAMKVEPVELTAREEVRICALVKAIGLEFATVDFALDENGQYVFLDLNPSGQWLFLEVLCPNARLLPRFCSYLCFGDVEAGPRFPSLADYQRSSDYEALKRELDSRQELREYKERYFTSTVSENLAPASSSQLVG
jgi:glutathione synthase/RimK-type ligase-like ATP-grasp enzyme